ncbi:hypothetical protein [Staphylococcus aureus]|uniref:hypothetical protein n=1 Tax=Staphylococcus aureus TaxID=1280 RepID=UPI00136492F9|nr:hypothetical protein [Staphylococcus aureus]
MVFKLSCVVGIKDINQSNRHYNAYWRGPNKEKFEKSAYNNVQVGDGPQHREFRKEILQAMQVGGAPTKRISKRNSTSNASWRGPNKENFEKKFYKQCKLAGPQQREFRKEILQAMQVGEGQQI